MSLEKRLKGKRLAIFAADFYEDLELWYPLLRFRGEGAETVVVGPGHAKEHHGKYGYPVTVDQAITDVNVEDFDAVVIPGGYAPDHMRRHPGMVKFVREMALGQRVVAAICHGPWMLASAEVVAGKKVTCFFAIKDDLVHAGAIYQDAEVVVDGNLITSRQPSDLPAFCEAIITALGGEVRCPACQKIL
ncbi:MAG: type 1 glutamine amidotransferase domain-containing protein [Desulfobaccales bacterium]